MKILSNTEEGGRVVELSKGEIKELYLLAKTCDESIMDEYMANWNLGAMGDYDIHRALDEFDFSELFSVVRAWRTAKFAVSRLRSLTDGIEKAINGS